MGISAITQIRGDAQEFDAKIVQRPFHADERILWFSTDLKTAPPQVCLLLASSPTPEADHPAFFLELNDQTNGRDASDIERIDASRTKLRVVFKRGKGVYPGYVNHLRPRRVRYLVVTFCLRESIFKRLKMLLEGARRDGCLVRVRDTATPAGATFTTVKVAG